MEKKNGLLTAALLATVLFMGGCSSEDSEMGTGAAWQPHFVQCGRCSATDTYGI